MPYIRNTFKLMKINRSKEHIAGGLNWDMVIKQ